MSGDAARTDERRRQARALRGALRDAMGRRLQKQLLPVDGQWMDASAVQVVQRRNRRQAWVVLVELLLLFAVLGILSYVLVALTQTLAY
jgi:hypothetical protein